MFNPYEQSRSDRYGVRLESESIVAEEFGEMPKISYSYQFSKPANAISTSVQIGMPTHP